MTRIGVDIGRYPAVLEHLRQWEDRLRRRTDQGDHWWELRSCDYYDAFDKPKIIYPDIAKEPRFHLDREGVYFSNTTYFIPTDDEFLLAVLNSSILWEYAKNHLSVMGDIEKGGRLRFFSRDFLKFPIPHADDEQKKRIKLLARKCLESINCDHSEEENEIDELVYSAYFSKIS